MSDLTKAIANSDWTLRTPLLARRRLKGRLVTGYVAAVLGAHGAVDHYQSWVEDGGHIVATSDPAEHDTAPRAVADADAVLAWLATAGAR